MGLLYAGVFLILCGSVHVKACRVRGVRGREYNLNVQTWVERSFLFIINGLF